MGWSFPKSVKIAPGIRINLSKSGLSASIGGKGFRYNTRGRVSAGLPGTGLRFTHNLKGARRTSHSANPIVSESRNANGFEQLSKREQATQDFVEKVQSRTASALVNYFLTHGVYVNVEDLNDAFTLQHHQAFLQSLSREFEVTTRAIRLAVDIGSISLAEKEKAMRAVYDIEAQCIAHQGRQGELGQAASSLLDAVRRYPVPLSLTGSFVVGLAGACITYALSVGVGLSLTIVALVYGGYKALKFFRDRDAALAVIEAADHRFEALLTAEITQRPMHDASPDDPKLKVIGLVSTTMVALIAAMVMHVLPPKTAAVRDVASSAHLSADANASQTLAPAASREEHTFSWVLGKHPHDVVTDRRFRAAFRGVSRADWEEITDRLTVASQDGIQAKDGFLVGDGCKQHQCDAEKAAFAINENTGKGVLMVMKTPNKTPTFTTYRWKDLPIRQTPLANWKQQQLADSAMAGGSPPVPATAANTAPTYPTSFDCSQAHSDAEHLICGDAQLAAADIGLAGMYAQAKAAAVDQAAFQNRTRAQWRYREQTCHDLLCLTRWYADQRVALTEIATTGAVEQ